LSHSTPYVLDFGQLGPPLPGRQFTSALFAATRGELDFACGKQIARFADGVPAAERIADYSQRSSACRNAAPAAAASVIEGMTTVLSSGRSEKYSGLSRLCG